tara:strand:+ start:1877 stop:3334 length:1458 start_codon:yes stop_codon:yes gene_type:complete
MSGYKLKNKRPLGKGFLSEAGSIEDPVLAASLKGYKARVAKGYRTLTKEDIKNSIHSGNYFMSPKVDGELWFLIIESKDVWLGSPQGKVISGDIPLLKEAASLSKKAVDRTVLVGELFASCKKGRPRIGDLASAIGGGKKAEVDRLGFMAFDLLEGGDKKNQVPLENYGENYSTIKSLLGEGERVQSIRTDIVSSANEIESLFEELVEAGKAEGLVVRGQTGPIFKIKPAFTVDMVVLGYTERTGDNTQVRSILLGLMRSDGQYQVVGACGTLKSDQNRKSLMKKLKPLRVQSSFRYASGSGEIYHFVKPEVIAEIKVTDIQTENAAGEGIKSMIINFKDNSWVPVRPLPSASLLHPVFERIRTDKETNKVDIRFSQLLERVVIKDIDQKIDLEELPKSKLLRREIWVKVSKGKKAVQKLIVWKTNKEKKDLQFPSFVIHWTDYSPNRKDPLKREVRLAAEEKQAIKIAEDMIEQNIKKGWEKIA